MKVVVATANTMEQWENCSHTLGVFSSIEVFEKWLHENYIVDDIICNKSLLGEKFSTYYIFSKRSITDGSGDYYEVYDEDGEEEYEMNDIGEFVTLKELEVIV